MNASGITNKLIRFSKALVGHLHGGLAHVNVVVSMFFAGISGSSTADAAGIGSVLIPAMIKEKYDRQFTVAVTACSSVMGVIIPPSIIMVVWGGITNVSVAAPLSCRLRPRGACRPLPDDPRPLLCEEAELPYRIQTRLEGTESQLPRCYPARTNAGHHHRRHHQRLRHSHRGVAPGGCLRPLPCTGGLSHHQAPPVFPSCSSIPRNSAASRSSPLERLPSTAGCWPTTAFPRSW